MPEIQDISQLIIGDEVYNIKDAQARSDIGVLQSGLTATSNEVVALRASVGHPEVITDAADFNTADQSKLYAYMGTTSGNFTHAHWYYYDGGWQDGGEWGTAVEVDDTLTVQDQAADAKATGDKIDDLKNILNYLVAATYSPDFDVIAGGILTSGANMGTTNSLNPLRARTQYIQITPGNIYEVKLSNDSYEIVTAFIYTGSTQESLIRRLTLSNTHDFLFKADNTATRFRFSFKAVDNHELTSTDYTSIKSSITLYTLTDESLSTIGVPADAKAVGDQLQAISSMFKNDIFVTPRISASTDGKMNIEQGNVQPSNGENGSSNSSYHPYYARTSGQRLRFDCRIVLTNPVYEFAVFKYNDTPSSSSYVEMLSSSVVNNDIVIPLIADSDTTWMKLRFHRVDGEAMTSTDLEAIRNSLFLYYPPISKAFRPKRNEFERFYVKTNLAWPNVSDTTSGNAETTSETDVRCILALPDTYSISGDPVPLIMFCHGASCRITDDAWYSNSSDVLALIRTFTSAGYAVFDVNNTRDQAGGFNDWGCLPLMTAYIKAWEYIKNNYNVEHKLFLFSDSMGTPANLNMMKWYKGDIIASIMTGPRPVVKERYIGTEDDQIKKEMLIAYGMENDSILTDESFVVPSDSAWDDDRLRGFYHYENIININNTPYVFEKFPPMKVVVGQSDSNFLDQTRAYYQALSNAGNYVNYREIANATHHQACFLTLGSLKTEAIDWFNRFRNYPTVATEEA